MVHWSRHAHYCPVYQAFDATEDMCGCGAGDAPDPTTFEPCGFCGEQAADYELGEFYDPNVPEDAEVVTIIGHQSCGLAKGWEVA